MKRLALLSASLLLLVAAPAPAPAAPMPASTHRDISKVVDSFVKDVIMRRNLAAGWTIAGPDLRGGTTRAAWVNGTGVTAGFGDAFPAVGRNFGNAWELTTLDSPTQAEITINLHSGGKNPQVISAQAIVEKQHGRWVVDTFVPAMIIRTSPGHRGSCASKSCSITGIHDFGAGSTAHVIGGSSASEREWMWIGLGTAGGLLAAIGISALFYVRIRNRRAMRAYLVNTGQG